MHTQQWQHFFQASTRSTRRHAFVVLVVTGIHLVATINLSACPFCSAVSLTFTQEIDQSEVAVVAKLIEGPDAESLKPTSQGPLPKGRFKIVEILKGGDLAEAAGLLGPDAETIEAILLEDKPLGGMFLLLAIEPPKLFWSSPITLGPESAAYLRKLQDLPKAGADRLAFFQDYLEYSDETMARDAYDEFAVAPYADVRGLRDQMHPEKLLAWIENPKVQSSRRRLYATMLGVCGSNQDADRMEAILRGKDSELRVGLDALIACFVTLRGSRGLDQIDELFLTKSDKEIPFTETYAAVMALRFLGEETEIVPRARVLESLERLLDQPKLADLVIADLARWEDWSALAKLEKLFAEANADNIFVREPIANYMKACPLPEAVDALERLRTIDPEAVRRAATLAGFALSQSAAVDGTALRESSDEDAGATKPNVTDSVDTVLTEDEAVMEHEDLAIAKQIAPVLADEDATDDQVPTDSQSSEGSPDAQATSHSRAPPAGRDESFDRSRMMRWGAWAVIVLIVAVMARMVMRPTGKPG